MGRQAVLVELSTIMTKPKSKRHPFHVGDILKLVSRYKVNGNGRFKVTRAYVLQAGMDVGAFGVDLRVFSAERFPMSKSLTNYPVHFFDVHKKAAKPGLAKSAPKQAGSKKSTYVVK
jgi:hypothetical protein